MRFFQRIPFKQSFSFGTNNYYDRDSMRDELSKAFGKSKIKKFYIIGYLDQPPFNITGKLLPPSVPIKIKLQRARDKFFIMEKKRNVEGQANDAALDDLNAKFVILNAQNDLTCIELNKRFNTALETKINSNNITFNYQDCKINAYVLHESLQEVQTTALSVGTQPSRVLIFLTDQKRYIGEYNKSSFVFNYYAMGFNLIKNILLISMKMMLITHRHSIFTFDYFNF